MLTSLVGSYPQPEWLVDREKLRSILPPRVRARDIWRIDPAYLEEAQDAAALVAIRDQERAGLDIVTDGEVRRESYSNFFVGALEGIDLDNPGSVARPQRQPDAGAARHGRDPRGAARCRCATSSSCARTPTGPLKVTVPGPFTMAAQAQNDFYEHPRDVAFAFADAVREEVDRAVRGRRRRRPARRAVDGVTSRAGARVRARDAAAGRSTASRAPRRCTSASAIRCSSPITSARTATWPSSPTRPSIRSRSSPPRPSST